MITAELLRFADSPFGVFGYLDLLDLSKATRVARFCTGEDDWLDNLVGQSCIPAGQYTCKRTTWHKTGIETFEITGVLNRSRVLFHYGNTEEDVEGCVLLGAGFGSMAVLDEDTPSRPLVHKWAIAPGTSRSAFKNFMLSLTGIDQFELLVVWAHPGGWR